MKKMNNKGFSLVELIIVIAIMAILIGVLAPQYIKYVEKSRVSADQDCADSIKNALMTATTDDELIYSLTDGDTVTFTTAGISTTATGIQAALDEYFKDWNNTSKYKVKSKSYQSSTYTATIEENDNVLKVSADWN